MQSNRENGERFKQGLEAFRERIREAAELAQRDVVAALALRAAKHTRRITGRTAVAWSVGKGRDVAERIPPEGTYSPPSRRRLETEAAALSVETFGTVALPVPWGKKLEAEDAMLGLAVAEVTADLRSRRVVLDEKLPARLRGGWGGA